MNAQELATTSWGRQITEVDCRALRRYQMILSWLCSTGEILVFGLLIAITGSTIWLVTQTNFENVIFYDGTDAICVFNGKTGEITNVK